MQRAEQIEKTRQVRKKLTEFFDKMVTVFGGDMVVYNLMTEEKRGYVDVNMFNTLIDIGVFRCDDDVNINLLLPEYTEQDLIDFGLYTEKGKYLMGGRYVLPIRDIDGTVISMVGWLPMGGVRKYITAITYGFSRATSFFNFDSYRHAVENYGGKTFEVEGIFGAVAIRSMGFPCVANMGLEMSYMKEVMLSRYRKVITIGDNDNGGKSINPLLASTVNSKIKPWRPKTDTVYVELPDLVEDPDDFVKLYDCKQDLLDAMGKTLYHKLQLTDSDGHQTGLDGQQDAEIILPEDQ